MPVLRRGLGEGEASHRRRRYRSDASHVLESDLRAQHLSLDVART